MLAIVGVERARKCMRKYRVAKRGIVVESEVGGEGVASSYPIQEEVSGRSVKGERA